MVLQWGVLFIRGLLMSCKDTESRHRRRQSRRRREPTQCAVQPGSRLKPSRSPVAARLRRRKAKRWREETASVLHNKVAKVWDMDQITIKTPNPKCRLYWCLIGFIDWRYSQSCWYYYFRPLLWTSASLTFSLFEPLPPPPPVWVSTEVCIYTV